MTTKKDETKKDEKVAGVEKSTSAAAVPARVMPEQDGKLYKNVGGEDAYINNKLVKPGELTTLPKDVIPGANLLEVSKDEAKKEAEAKQAMVDGGQHPAIDNSVQFDVTPEDRQKAKEQHQDRVDQANDEETNVGVQRANAKREKDAARGKS